MIAELALSINQSMAEIPPHAYAPVACYAEQEYPSNSQGSNSGRKIRSAKLPIVWDNFSSSGANWRGLFERWSIKDHTASWPQPFANLDNSAKLEAVARSNSVDINSVYENIFEIRRLTDLSWSKIADVLCVDRRTVNNWLQGKPVREANKLQIFHVLASLRYVDRGQAETNKALLLRDVDGGSSALALLAQGNWDAVKNSLSFADVKSKSQFALVDPVRHSASLMTYSEADGSEVSESLPMEAMPTSVKRTIVRSEGR